MDNDQYHEELPLALFELHARKLRLSNQNPSRRTYHHRSNKNYIMGASHASARSALSETPTWKELITIEEFDNRKDAKQIDKTTQDDKTSLSFILSKYSDAFDAQQELHRSTLPVGLRLK